VFGSCNLVLSCVVIYFASLDLELSFQLTVGRIGLYCLCSFMVLCICGAVGFMLMYLHLLFLLCFYLLCFVVYL
jgi:hypothetical protein